jgi:lipopolysaccharide export system protein LptA
MVSLECLMKPIHFNTLLERKTATIAALMILTLSLYSDGMAQTNVVTDDLGFGSGQIQITSAKLIADSRENSAEFIDHVKAIQRDTIITSDRMKVFFKKGAVKSADEPAQDALVKIVITGNVDIKFDNGVAQAQEAVYIAEKKRLVLSGPNTKIIRDKNTITGEKITITIENGRIQVIQVEAGQGDRVEAIIYPEKKKR